MLKMAKGSGTLRWLSSREYNGCCQFQTSYMRLLLENVKCMYPKNLFAHYGCVNAIEFSSDGEWLSSGGDDRRVLLWNIRRTIALDEEPIIMKGEHNSNIFCLGFGNSNTKVFSAGNDEQVIIHNIENGETLDVFLHEEAVYGLSVDPFNNDVFASACDNGQILVWDTRQPATTNPLVLAQSSSAFHAVVYNPVESRLLATANAKEGVSLWDIRKPRINLLSFGGCFSAQSSMSVRFSQNGMKVLALRRRLPPVLYNISSPCPMVEFDHPGYYNSCTMKSCTFAGDNDQYVMSGSDDFKLYMWRIPSGCDDKKGMWINTAHLVLKGHRSIVNQVRFSSATNLIASSGVEKVVKLWSLFPLPNGEGSKEKKKKERNSRSNSRSSSTSNQRTEIQDPRHVYSHEEYINLVLESGQFMNHDYSHKSMNEDPRMMAFFDSLVQRDIEGWTSDSSESSIDQADGTDKESLCLEVQSIPSSSASPSPTLTDQDSSSDELPLSVQNDSFVPQTLSYITNLTSRVESNLLNLHQNTLALQEGDAGGSDEVNRISQLIARKRHEQLLRTARSTVKLTQKKLKRTKNGNTFVLNANKVMNVEEKALASVRKILDSVLLRQTQNHDDQRRALTRRTRVCQSLSDSSDQTSDDTSATSTVVSLAGNSSNDRVDELQGLNSDVTANQNGNSEGETSLLANCDERVVTENNNSNGKFELRNSGALNVISINTTEDNISNGNSEEFATSSRFRPINNKHSKRNYRVNNQENEDDD